MIIISTSLIGAYAAVRSISGFIGIFFGIYKRLLIIFSGGFPNEFLIYANIQVYGTSEVTWKFYMYLVFILGLAIGGGIFQFKTRKEDISNDSYHSVIPESYSE